LFQPFFSPNPLCCSNVCLLAPVSGGFLRPEFATHGELSLSPFLLPFVCWHKTGSLWPYDGDLAVFKEPHLTTRDGTPPASQLSIIKFSPPLFFVVLIVLESFFCGVIPVRFPPNFPLCPPLVSPILFSSVVNQVWLIALSGVGKLFPCQFF